jgi:hypothetical protein
MTGFGGGWYRLKGSSSCSRRLACLTSSWTTARVRFLFWPTAALSKGEACWRLLLTCEPSEVGAVVLRADVVRSVERELLLGES